MSVKYGTEYTTSTGNSSFRVCTNYTITTDSTTGVKTVKYYYYLEVTKGGFEGTSGYVSWNPSETWYINNTGIYQTSPTYTLTIRPGVTAQNIPSATGGYLNTSSIRSTVDAISVSSTTKTTATFNKNDGTGATLTQDFIYGVSGNRFGYNNDGTPKWTQTGQFGQWDRVGYTLLGWSTEGENATSEQYTTYNEVTNNWISYNAPSITLYAVWKPNTYTITFDCNGGVTSIDSLETTYETEQNNNISQYTPTRQAYEFCGWYTSPTGGIKVYDANGLCANEGTYWLNNVCIYTNDYTLYAQWKALNVAYYKNEGEWKLCRTYIKINNTWKPTIMYIKSNNKYIR